jgi:hypothetical protein
MLIPALKVASLAAKGTVLATNTLAAAVAEANETTDAMIDKLKSSENLTVNRVGRVLEGTKFGFLLGYLTPSILTAVGVTLTTGNLLSAVAGGIAVLGNPVAGVCAAVGAVYFGWKALSDKERKVVLDQVCEFLLVGVEQIKAVINFALNLMSDLLTSDNFKEIKATVAEAASVAGRNIADITHSIKDKAFKAAQTISDTASSVSEAATSAAGNAADTVKDKATGAAQVVSRTGEIAGGLLNRKNNAADEEDHKDA